MCEGSEVAGCSERTLLIHHRQDVVVEHIDQSLHCNQLNTGMSI